MRPRETPDQRSAVRGGRHFIHHYAQSHALVLLQAQDKSFDTFDKAHVRTLRISKNAPFTALTMQYLRTHLCPFLIITGTYHIQPADNIYRNYDI